MCKGYLTLKKKLAIKAATEDFCKQNRFTSRSHQLMVASKVWLLGPATKWVRRASRWIFMIYPKVHLTHDGQIKPEMIPGGTVNSPPRKNGTHQIEQMK